MKILPAAIVGVGITLCLVGTAMLSYERSALSGAVLLFGGAASVGVGLLLQALKVPIPVQNKEE